MEKAFEDKGGFDVILLQLDQTCKSDDQFEMPTKFERIFFFFFRWEGQNLLKSVAEHCIAMAGLEKNGMSLPHKVAGWVLCR